MNKYQSIFLTLICATLIVYTACKKQEPDYYPLSQTSKDWMFFDVGTWWVYEDMNTGRMDSQYVTKSIIETFGPYRKDNIITEVGEVYITGINIYIYNLASESGGYLIEKIQNVGTEGGSTTLYYPDNAIGSYSSASTSKVIDFNPGYTFQGKPDTLIVRLDTKDYSENSDSVEYHIFKGSGIIRKINHTKKEDWQLLRYHTKMNN